ncbi:putative heme iron utilization protein [Candidatus Terasakiella magnetica]|uniref:Putative heme iron utilization protein n=1 Tax=Candidatus Terasakiella magnetica TaxID=1867952 RepID=A0A1C3RLQ6_9PROT|nr:pyridoxamine 5'-phosphate oxidase family protein [Candidatus Terasakiella magnetica]SCA58224.1 putative heme iron utilization protein [Candidatus Terasakiella magnetica]
MDIGFEARKIARACRSGSMATLDRETGLPYVSFCACAFDYQGQPIFLFSDLADHTQNILKKPSVSFLCEQASQLSNPQAGPRVSLVGEMGKIEEEEVCSIFMQLHPSAKMYANFGDFNFYRLKVEKAHYVGGFGKAVWLDDGQYLGDSAASLFFSKNQLELIKQLNTELPEFARTCATKLLKQRGKNWQVLRLDGDGIDLKLASRVIRYPFENNVKNMNEAMDLLHNICS